MRRWLATAHGRRVLPRIEQAAKRYGLRSLFFARYFYGARIATMFFWGMRQLAYHKFLPLDALNCFLWATVLGGLGYLFSNSLEEWIGKLHWVESWLLVGLLVFAILWGARYFLIERGRIGEEVTKGGTDL